MKKIFSCFVLLLFYLSLNAQSTLLVDLIHGVDSHIDGNGNENNIPFSILFQEFNIDYLEKSSIVLDEELVNEIQSGDQQLIYIVNLPPQKDLKSVKTLYVFAECISPSNYDYYPTGDLLNPQDEIVAEMFQGLIHYDNVYGNNWQVEINLGGGDEYQIIIGYGDVLFNSDEATGLVDLENYDCAIRVVDETYFAIKGTPNEYSYYDTLAFAEAFDDSLGFLNVYHLQDVFWLKPFVHCYVEEDIDIDFEVNIPGSPTLAEPHDIMNKGIIGWNNKNTKKNDNNELLYEAAFDSRMNFLYCIIRENEIQVENLTSYPLDNIFLFKYIDENTYLMSWIETLEGKDTNEIRLSKQYTTQELRSYLKNNFYTIALENNLTEEEADQIVNDYIWIESLLRRARDYPSEYFGFYHFNGELYDKLVPYTCDPKPEVVQRNAWVMLSNIKNRGREPIIEFPQEQINDRSIKEGFTLREYGVADEHYTRTLSSKDNIFNVELDEFLEGETYGFEPLFYDNTLSDLLSQYIDELYLGNGEYSFIIDDPAENSILYLYTEPNKPTAVLSYAGINGKVISFGSAGFFVYEYGTDYEQFINNCANYLVGNEIIEYGIDEPDINSQLSTLEKNYPNPSQQQTTISFSIPHNSKVTITVYNLKGQKVRTLTNDRYSRGEYSIVWNGCDDASILVSPGVYFYKLACDGVVPTVEKCVIIY